MLIIQLVLVVEILTSLSGKHYVGIAFASSFSLYFNIGIQRVPRLTLPYLDIEDPHTPLDSCQNGEDISHISVNCPTFSRRRTYRAKDRESSSLLYVFKLMFKMVCSKFLRSLSNIN